MNDQTTKPKTETERLFSDLNKPSLHALSYALRHPDTWPDGFVWNYGQCSQCAMGLAHRLWLDVPKAGRDSGASVMARRFAIPYEAASSIFFGMDGAGAASWVPDEVFIRTGMLWWKKKENNWDAITPSMVADQIDAYLAQAE